MLHSKPDNAVPFLLPVSSHPLHSATTSLDITLETGWLFCRASDAFVQLNFPSNQSFRVVGFWRTDLKTVTQTLRGGKCLSAQNAAHKSLWFTDCFDNSKSGASRSHKPVLMEKKLVSLGNQLWRGGSDGRRKSN